MSKADRQKIFEMFGGKCAYCGCELEKGWHVDHVEQIIRNRRFEPAGYFKDGKRFSWTSSHEVDALPQGVKWRDSRWVEDGCRRPENDHLGNMMPSCPSCNINKHGDTIEGFRESIAMYLRSLNKRIVQYKMVKKYRLVQETGNPVVFYFETLTPNQ